MMSVEQLAKLAYETHVKTVDPRRDGFNAQPWDRLETRFKAGWIAAVQAVRTEINKPQGAQR